jgi:hypothetical protein
LTDKAISPEESIRLISAIEEKGWWQGSVLAASDLSVYHAIAPSVEFLVVASQTCNLYNSDLSKVPLVEFVGGRRIESCDAAKVKGDNPRVLHVEAASNSGSLCLELDIQARVWIPRQLLAELPASSFRLRDAPLQRPLSPQDRKWNDSFAGWLARSYTRVTLPDAFNQAFRASRIEKAIEAKLTKRHADIYGIYFAIDTDAEVGWYGALGEMPPPYLLGIMIIVEDQADSELIRVEFVNYLFESKIQDPEDIGVKTTRAELARRRGIRIISEDIAVKSVAEVTLQEMKQLVRFSMNDHLSDSSMGSDQ